MKVRWRVSPAPTGAYRSFHRRGWPDAEYSNGEVAARITCEDDYRPSLVKEGKHSELCLFVADHSKSPWQWLKLKKRFKTLKEAKEAFDHFISKYPNVVHGGAK